MLAGRKEVELAKDEGVEVLELLAPVEIVGDKRGRVRGVICQAMRTEKMDLTGRRKTLPIEGKLHEIEADLVIYALGFSSNYGNPGILAYDDPFLRENLIIHSDGSTNFLGIFVGGDTIRKQDTVQSIADGQIAAVKINSFLVKGI
jgi:NADPH-dependent glutamate synthase beta subunit-like oxidoreductase